jgi:hypothetical protein
MTTTGAAPGAASASAIGRPMSGGTLATRNPAAEISATAASSTDPSGVMMLRRIARCADVVDHYQAGAPALEVLRLGPPPAGFAVPPGSQQPGHPRRAEADST